ncbi:MAG: EAL domain-containing protein [Candidatus Dormibacteria bacterium]
MTTWHLRASATAPGPNWWSDRRRGFAGVDVGTGYSSLAHLNDFPIDMLKADRSFISELSLDAVKPPLAGVLINLGASIGATVVAEGVETEEQLRALTAMHCPLYQGFYLSRPVDAGRPAALPLRSEQPAVNTPV